MNPFEFSIPQNIIVGAGTLAKLPECAKKMGGTHAMILSGPTLKKMGVVEKAAESLTFSSNCHTPRCLFSSSAVFHTTARQPWPHCLTPP